jgi:hypothetical protein
VPQATLVRPQLVNTKSRTPASVPVSRSASPNRDGTCSTATCTNAARESSAATRAPRPALVVYSLADLGNVEVGDILVAPNIDPG